MMDAFGFGERPPLEDLPSGEMVSSGRFNGEKLLSNSQPGEDVARIAIGQERLLATPLQMAMVAAAIANGGTMQRPYLVARVRDRKGDVIRQTRPDTLGEAVRSDVAADVSAMMRNVVKEGTGIAAALAGLEVAGKTGTAEISADAGNMAWFIGFAPANDPQVVVAVRIENTSQTGGVIAAPIAGKVMAAALEAVG
jgi:peptidoglycan glycosyltransferase